MKLKQGDIIANGRKAALQCLDSLLSDHHNIQKLHDSLQETFDASPTGFFQDIVMPLLPRETVMQMGDDKTPVRITLSSGPEQPSQVPAPAPAQASSAKPNENKSRK